MISYNPTEYNGKDLKDAKFFADLAGSNHSAIKPVFFADALSLNAATQVITNFTNSYSSVANAQNAPQKYVLIGSLTLTVSVVAGPADYEIGLISLLPAGNASALTLYRATAAATTVDITSENIRMLPDICFNHLSINQASPGTEILVQWNFNGLQVSYF